MKIKALLLFLILLISCSTKNAEKNIVTEEDFIQKNETSEYESDNNYTNTQRKLIKTADITIKSKNVDQIYNLIDKETKVYGGFISHSTKKINDYAYIEIRIPQNNFETFINEIEKLQTIDEKSIFTVDQTQKYYDTEARIKNRETLLVKLRNYLKEAKNIEEILKVEDRINSLTYEIEVMKGDFKQLQNSIEYSTISVSIKEPANFQYKFLKLKDFLNSFFSNIIFIITGFVGIAVPLVLIIALFYFIAFGKIGLVRKLFNKIK